MYALPDHDMFFRLLELRIKSLSRYQRIEYGQGSQFAKQHRSDQDELTAYAENSRIRARQTDRTERRYDFKEHVDKNHMRVGYCNDKTCRENPKSGHKYDC
jgi:hypothetical protein